MNCLLRRHLSDNALPKLASLRSALAGTSSIKEKIALVRNLPELHPLLSTIFLNQYADSFNITSRSIRRQLDYTKEVVQHEELESLLNQLAQRQVSGHAAIATVQQFIEENKEFEDLILAVLDKKLGVGLGARIFRRVLEQAKEVPKETIAVRHISLTSAPSGGKTRFPKTNKELPVALGYPLQKVRINDETWDDHWLVSRKLDGIRCLAHFDQENQTHLFTRSGKSLDHLSKIRNSVHHLGMIIKRTCPDLESDFFLDGELCVMSRVKSSMLPAALDHASDDDFPSALSIVLSRPGEEVPKSNAPLVYCLFDLFPAKGSEKILSERLAHLQAALTELESDVVYLLPQQRHQRPLEQIKSLLQLAHTYKWEGLMLRRDAVHVPRRTRDMLKIKEFSEAEFVVKDYRLEEMAVNEGGRHCRETLLSSVMIDFLGAPVWVGSGLTLEQRRRYAADPKLILGSQITVRYFEESTNKNRLDGSKSLRFPTIKAIHEGKRLV